MPNPFVKYIKKKQGSIIIMAVFFMMGAFVSFILTHESEDVSFRLNWMEGISFGSTSSNYVGLDFVNISDSDAAVLVQKFSQLPPENQLSKKVIGLLIDRQGPFAKLNTDVIATVKFISGSAASGKFAIACKQGQYFGYELNLYEIQSGISLQNPHRMTKVETVSSDLPAPLQCDAKSSKIIWIDKNKAREWLGIDDAVQVPEEITVKARIISYKAI